ncbi:phage integrase SAM-like domain-containing protein [Robertmurraya sp. P23]|uniref:phage integrase SAM-like domain-containing protein n=1 Tax=Robertmurraya sp. P23 TaxID=3436931 RepID=UPI003D9944AE
MELHIVKHIVPFMGDQILSEITEREIILFHQHLDEKNLSDSTIVQILKTLSIVFQAAVKGGLIKENPMRNISFKQYPKVHTPILWSQEERGRFLVLANLEQETI